MVDRDTLISKIEECKSALLQDPKSTLFVNLSDFYRQLDEFDDALEVALKGTWELPEFAPGFVAVGRVYTVRKVYSKAENYFYKALAIDQMCIPAYKGLARICKEQGDISKASDILTKAIMLDPGDTSLQKMIEALSGAVPQPVAGSPGITGQTEPAVTEEPAMDQPSEGMKPITTATIADIYIEQGLYAKALQVYQELLNDNPQNVTVQQKISELEALMNADAPQSASVLTDPQLDKEGVIQELSSPVVGNETVIEKLNGWLESIQARRNRV